MKMKINKIEMINFRQYENTTINFDDKFTSFIGDNASGKSTIRGAILFGLYGFDYIVENKIFPKVLKNSDANEIKNNKQDSNEVIVKLELEIEGEAQFTVETKLDVRRRECKQKILVKKNSNDGLLEEIHRIDFEKYYPRSFARFSIVHGEKLNDISSILGKKTGANTGDIKAEVEKITNIVELKDKLSILKKSRKLVEIEVINNIETSDEIRQDYIRLEKVSLALEELENSRTNTIDRINDYEGKIAEFENELEKIEQIKQINHQKEIKEKDKEKLESELKNYLDNMHTEGYKNSLRYCFSKFFRENIGENMDSFNPAIPGLSQEGVEHILSNGVCICGHKIVDENYDHLEKVRENQPPKNMVGDIKARVIRYTEDTEDFPQMIESSSKKIRELRTEINNIKLDLSDLETKKKITADNENKQVELRKKEKIHELIGVNKKRKLELDDEIERQKREVLGIREKIKIREKNGKNRTVYEKMEEVLTEAVNEVENEINRIEIDTKNTLREKTEQHLNEILKDNSTVKINSKYLPEILFANGTNAPSDGQNDVISLCYLFGLMDTVKAISDKYGDIMNNSNDSFPIVLDGIFGKLDARNIEKVMMKINEYPGQVIMMNSDEKFDSVRKYFKEDVACYEINRIENASASFIKKVESGGE